MSESSSRSSSFSRTPGEGAAPMDDVDSMLPPRPAFRRRRTTPVPQLRAAQQAQRGRPRSLSVYPHASSSRSGFPFALLASRGTETIESLDLPTSLPALLTSLRAFLLGNVREVEDHLKVLSEDLDSSASEEDEELLQLLDSVSQRLGHDGTRKSEAVDKGKGKETSTEATDQVSAIHNFIEQVSAYLSSLKADLFSIDINRIGLSPATRTALDDLLARRPSLSLTQTPRLDDGPPLPPSAATEGPPPAPADDIILSPDVPDAYNLPDARQLLAVLSVHTERVHELLTQLTLYCKARSPDISRPRLPPIAVPNAPSYASFGFSPSASIAKLYDSVVPSFHLPTLPTLPYPPDLLPLPSPSSLTEYFSAESERLASLLPDSFSDSLAQQSERMRSTLAAYRDEARHAIHDGEEYIHRDLERFREWIDRKGEKLKSWVDAEADKFKEALAAGKGRLLSYQELPAEWKNNPHITEGYRFIPLDRWSDLLLSGVQWHNETVNIHTHFLGAMVLIYVLVFLWPSSSFVDANLGATPTDRLISLVFIGCALKCLLCSAAWHLFAGCASIGSFKRLACVDYIGISGLIAASVIGIEYYGFYCRRDLAWTYIAFSTIMGVVGMVLPFQHWFDGPDSKMVRIAFFVSMACSAMFPVMHMSALYGVTETVMFYRPIVPSIACYLGGLFFYATNYPEKLRPGVFNHLFHSHQWWHVCILGAIWLHWRALSQFHQLGRDGFSCARPDEHLWDKIVEVTKTQVAQVQQAGTGKDALRSVGQWVISHW